MLIRLLWNASDQNISSKSIIIVFTGIELFLIDSRDYYSESSGVVKNLSSVPLRTNFGNLD